MSWSCRFGNAGIVWAAVLALFLLAPTPAAAQVAKPATSLEWIPEDAAFYSVSLHNKEQLDIVAKSKAWAKLWEMKSVQMAWQKLQAQWDAPEGPFEPIKSALSLEENKELLALGMDMISEEIFVYGDSTWTDFTSLTVQVMGAVQYGPTVIKLSGEPQDAGDEIVAARMALDTLNENLDKLRLPDLVIGFKVSDREAALRQLKRLEPLAQRVMKETPPLKGRFKRSKMAGGQFLMLQLDGSMIPWDQISWSQIEREEGDYEAVVAKLKSMTLTVHLGVLNDFVVLSIGDSGLHLQELTSPKRPLLYDRAEFKPLREAVKKRMVGVGYISQAIREATATNKSDIDALVEMAAAFLPGIGVDDDLKARIHKDIEGLAEDIKSAIPKVGAALTYSYLAPGGMETLSYDWTEDLYSDSSKPLTLLDHLGGSPIMAFVARSKHSEDHEGYKKLVKYIQLLYGYFEDYGVPQMPPEGRERYDLAKEKLMPLIERLDEVTRTKLLPALADEQAAFVLDAKIKSKQWLAMMPATEEELPMAELAILLGVSDAALLVEAMSDYREIINEGLTAMKDILPEEFPPIQIPPPQTKKVAGGAIYWYPLPEEAGLDPQILPHALLGKTVAGFSSSPDQSERVLAETPLKMFGSLADTSRPLASAAHFDWNGLLDAVVPWIKFGVQTGMRESSDPDAAGQLEFVLGEIDQGVEILKCFRGASSVTYTEDDVQVTHSVSYFQDLE